MPDDGWQWRSDGYAWWVVLVLMMGMTLSLADRLIMGLMIAPMRHDLSLSNTEISLLHGLAFTILYVLAGLPLGRFADRGSRRGLAAVSIITWSLMTGVCGLSRSFTQLFAARLGVGVGEAGLSPAAVSMVADYFPASLRARPLTFLSIGTSAGSGLALMFGGMIVNAVGVNGAVRLPLLGSVHGWQAVFLLFGFLGLIFATIFFTVREPQRRECAHIAEVSIGVIARFIVRRKAFFVPQVLGPSFSVMAQLAFHSWMPTVLMSKYHWNVAVTGMGYGCCVALSGVTGILLGGWLAQRRRTADALGTQIAIAAWAALGAFVPLIIAPWVQAPTACLVVLGIGMTMLVIPAALAPSILQGTCPNQMRGQVFGVYMLVMSSIGYILGPLGVAWIADHLFAGPRGLSVGISIVAGVGAAGSAICLMTARTQRHRLNLVQQG